jgi:Sigma 54 modulation protein / S30EA ribosomal protein.
MKTNIRTTFRNIRSFDELTETIARETRKLQGIYSLITNCKVTIDRPHHNDGNRKRFRVRVMVSVPGKQLISTSEAREGYFDILTAVTETFNTVRDSVNSYMRRRKDVRSASPKANTSARWEHPLDLNDAMNYATFP